MENSVICIIDLSKSLECLPSLTVLNIVFTQCAYTPDNAVRKFLGGLRRLKLTHEGFKTLSNELYQITSLSRLNLDFFECLEMDDSDLENPSGALQNLMLLIKLKLNFGDYPKTTDLEIISLSSVVKALTLLSFLKIELMFALILPMKHLEVFYIALCILIRSSDLNGSLMRVKQSTAKYLSLCLWV